MNAFLWLGVASTGLLIVSLLIDGFDGVFDLLDGVEVGGDWLSLPVLAAFFGAFGFGAGAFYGPIGLAALIPGLLLGSAFAIAAVRLINLAGSGPQASPETQASLVGAIGRIVTVPGPTSYGEVLLSRVNGPTKFACRASEAISLGTEVVVIDAESSTLVTVVPLNLEQNP